MAKRASQQSQDYQEPEPQNNGNGLDPLVDAMLGHIPAPGESWPKQDRELWMQILGLIFQLIYPEYEQGTGDPAEPGHQPGA